MSSARPAPVELVADGDRRFADEERRLLHVRPRAVSFQLSAGLALVLVRDLAFGKSGRRVGGVRAVARLPRPRDEGPPSPGQSSPPPATLDAKPIQQWVAPMGCTGEKQLWLKNSSRAEITWP